MSTTDSSNLCLTYEKDEVKNEEPGSVMFMGSSPTVSKLPVMNDDKETKKHGLFCRVFNGTGVSFCI